jgi:hypothetical protein
LRTARDVVAEVSRGVIAIIKEQQTLSIVARQSIFYAIE